MNRRIAVLFVFSIAIAFGIFAALWLLRKPPSPTTLGWQANILTIAGDGSPAFRDNAQSSQAAFADPFGIAVGQDGNIYIADAGKSNRIRTLSNEGIVTTLAGGTEGFADGMGTDASFNSPSGLAIDSEGNLYVADTGNNRIRKITPQGLVSTLAGDGTAGHLDGPATEARFNGPIGVAVDPAGNVYIADTYNDCIRKITTNGEVSTVAGGGEPGSTDGDANVARFDTPSGLIATSQGELIVADTGNNRLRRVSSKGVVTTISLTFSPKVGDPTLRQPVGLAATHDGFLYLTEYENSRVVQIAPDGAARIIAGIVPSVAGSSPGIRLRQLAGIAIDSDGDLYVADSGNYLIRKLAQKSSFGKVEAQAQNQNEVHPRLTAETLSQSSLPWPLDPQEQPHEVVATMGEVRGSFDSEDGRHHLHSGLDVFGGYGETVRVVRTEKVVSPLANWAFGDLNEGVRIATISYVHIYVGRDKDDTVFRDSRFLTINGDDGKPERIRIKRGARFTLGDALGTVNRMYHVHLIVGPPGAEINPLSLAPIRFSDQVAPIIESDGIHVLNDSGTRLTERIKGRLIVGGRVRIVVDAFDRNDLNTERRRLGLYRLGYQILNTDGTAAPGFEEPRITILFDRLPADRHATKLAYAEESGITVYGSKSTRFLYEVTNMVRGGQASAGFWDTSQLAKGDYTLRIIAADYSGNEVQKDRDLLITIK